MIPMQHADLPALERARGRIIDKIDDGHVDYDAAQAALRIIGTLMDEADAARPALVCNTRVRQRRAA